jgi:hypothetical protein
VGEGMGAGADGIAGGQNVSTPQHKLLVAPLVTPTAAVPAAESGLH